MDYKLIFYKDIGKRDWDNYVNEIGEAGFHHSWSWINYISKFPGVKENLSFVQLSENGEALAICPLAISYNESGNYYEMSFGGNPCATPAIADVKPNFRKNLLDDLFEKILDFSQKFTVKKIFMIWDPLVKYFSTNGSFHLNNFDLLRYQMHYYVENVVVIPLNVDEEVLLENLSKYQRKHVRRSSAKGVTVQVFDDLVDSGDTKKYFDSFREAHVESAGRLTRPIETWEAMYDCILVGEATLFVGFVGEIPISYLYCGQFGLVAFGWSQVNNDRYESEYSPRHLVEWTAIKFYREKKFRYYEIGERYYGTQFLHNSSKKEISIGVFKERFGGVMLPKIRWTGYLDAQSMVNDYTELNKIFLTELPLVRFPEN